MLNVYRYHRLMGGAATVLSDAVSYLVVMLLLLVVLAQVAKLAL